MTMFVWRMTLFGHRMLIHGDSLFFTYPLFDLRAKVATGQASALWVTQIFGGHPLFAEGQAAFAGPIPMLLAATVTPLVGVIRTMNLFPTICMILTGLGVLGLSRCLGLSRWASAFAAIAVIFSPIWLDMQANAGVAGPFLWVPWSMWAFEAWLKRPNVRQAALLGLAVANQLLAGYPQALHGTLIYMALSMLPIPFYGAERRGWRSTWHQRLGTGTLASLLALGISAVQWMTLLELVGQSHRNAGTTLFYEFPLDVFLRGLIYTFQHTATDMVDKVIPTVGSLFVCVAASWAVVVNTKSVRFAGHLLATLILAQMGFGLGWPPFKFAYDHHLIPGIHYFRVVFLYCAIAGIGVGVLAGWAVQGMACYFGSTGVADWHAPGPRRFALGSAILAIGWTVLVVRLPTTSAPSIEFIVVFGAAAAVIGSGWFGRANLLPAILTCLLVVECVSLRFHPFHMAAWTTVTKPESVVAIQALPDWQDYKVIDASTAPVFAFLQSDDPAAQPGARRMLSSMSGSTTILWGLHGMDGSLALPMARLTRLRPQLYDEIRGRTEALPGSRLIDVLGIRFIPVEAVPQAPGFRPFWQSDNVHIMENTAAMPRFQVFSRHVSVASLDAALEAARGLRNRTLIIENPAGSGHQIELADDTGDTEAVPANIRVERADPTSYKIDVVAERPCWLFLADANYPGWRATLDGASTPLFSADLLGKAVGVPKGRHTVTIEFHSVTFYRGLWISITTTLLALSALLFGGKLASSRPREARGQT